MEISQILSMLPSLYQIIKEILAKKGDSEATKKLEEYEKEILEKLEKVVKESKIKIDQQINIEAKGDVNIQQHYYDSPGYSSTVGKYAFDTAAGSISFLTGQPGAHLYFPDPKDYLSIMNKLNRVAEALEKQTEANQKPKVKIEIKGRWANGGCYIIIYNGGEPITLKKIIFKWEYIGYEGHWYDFTNNYDKKYLKGNEEKIPFEVPRHFIEEKVPKEMGEHHIKRIFFLINVKIEVQYEDSNGNKCSELLNVGKFV